ncbi:MAG: hypothetical protein IPK03_12100 [Bacteroidetes bacterium]|nr:hypothetical protein [Bacteroidota bacterium]
MNTSPKILNQKLELIQWLSTIEDSSIIKKIMDLRKKESKDWWNSIADKEKESIEIGLKEAESGKLTSHSKARKLYEKWL